MREIAIANRILDLYGWRQRRRAARAPHHAHPPAESAA
jgi:hypothetical protein